MKETRLNGYVSDFSVDYFDIYVSNILNIHKYLMKNNNVKQYLELLNVKRIISYHSLGF